ncbi:hypothetical protein Dimus_008416 [Dionaea muscipula]
MVGRRGWPKGHPRNVVVRSTVGLVGQGVAKGGNGGQESLIWGRTLGNCLLGEASQGGVKWDLVGVAQVEGSCAVSWAEECEIVSQGGRLHSTSPITLNGNFLKALTQSESGEETQTSQAQKQTLEGNRAMCNGLKLSGVDRRNEVIVITEEDVLEERAPKQQRKEWRPVLKVPGVRPLADKGERDGCGEVAQDREGVGSVRDELAVPVRGEAGRLDEDWQVVKGSSSSHCLPRSSPILVSASRFSPLDPGIGEALAEKVVGDMLGGILVPAMDAIT